VRGLAELGLQGGPDFRFRGLTVGNAFPTEQQQQLVLKRLGFSGIRSQQCSEEAIFRILDEHGPFLLMHHIGMFWYGATVPIPPQARGSGHAVVVTGLDVSRHIVFFHNPWGQRDVPTTASFICNAIARFESDPALYAIWYLKSPR
jgi:hypothetical protein